MIIQLQILTIGGLILLMSGCSVRNSFNRPKTLQENTDKKRLVIFLASDVGNRGTQSKQWNPGCFLICKASRSSVLPDLRLVRSMVQITLIWEWNVIDTGLINFIMAIANGNRMKARKLYVDTTIYIKDLRPGNNYWHWNFFNERDKNGLTPVMSLREIDLENDYIIGNSTFHFRHFLTYDVSSDSATFVRNKRIISKQRAIHSRYYKIRNEFKPVTLW